MSEFQDVANEIFAEVVAALAPVQVETFFGYKAPDDVKLQTDIPVFAMIFNPAEVSAPLDDAQHDRTVQYRLVLMRKAGMAAQMSDDVDAIRDEIQEGWAANVGPLNGLVETVVCLERLVDDRSDRAKTFGDILVQTTDVL